MNIHYSGYSDKHDEWRDAADIFDQPVVRKETYRPFELHRELALQIKLALTSANNRDRAVRIELPFDKLVFSGGLKQLGYYCHTTRSGVARILDRGGSSSHADNGSNSRVAASVGRAVWGAYPPRKCLIFWML